MSGRRRNFRKRKVVEEPEEEEEEEEEPGEEDTELGETGVGEEGRAQPAAAPKLSLREKLQDTKLLQKHRTRAKGLDASSLALGHGVEDDAGETRAKGMLGDAIDLSAAFNKEELVDENAEDPLMKKYIDEEMARRRGKAPKVEEEENDPLQERLRDEEDLYHVPDNLKVPIKSGDAGELAGWGAGIQEVPLSMEYKLKNIEETEAAKKALLEASARTARHKDAFEDNLPTNFRDIDANASRNNFVRQFGKDQWRGPKAVSTQHARSNDDQALARFRRKERDRWRR